MGPWPMGMVPEQKVREFYDRARGASPVPLSPCNHTSKPFSAWCVVQDWPFVFLFLFLQFPGLKTQEKTMGKQGCTDFVRYSSSKAQGAKMAHTRKISSTRFCAIINFLGFCSGTIPFGRGPLQDVKNDLNVSRRARDPIQVNPI